MRLVIDSVAAKWSLALEPRHTLIEALDGGVRSNGMIEGRRDMRQNAKRATGHVICRRRAVGSLVAMPCADHNTAERVRTCGGSGAHHRDRRKKLHQNRDHDDGNQMSQPLAHCYPHRIKIRMFLTKHGIIEMSISPVPHLRTPPRNNNSMPESNRNFVSKNDDKKKTMR